MRAGEWPEGAAWLAIDRKYAYVMRIILCMKSIQVEQMATKRRTNVTVDGDVLDEAREAGLNLSQTLERALTVTLRRNRQIAWQVENRKAIESINDHIERHGLFGDGHRRF